MCCYLILHLTSIINLIYNFMSKLVDFLENVRTFQASFSSTTSKGVVHMIFMGQLYPSFHISLPSTMKIHLAKFFCQVGHAIIMDGTEILVWKSNCQFQQKWKNLIRTLAHSSIPHIVCTHTRAHKMCIEISLSHIDLLANIPFHTLTVTDFKFRSLSISHIDSHTHKHTHLHIDSHTHYVRAHRFTHSAHIDSLTHIIHHSLLAHIDSYNIYTHSSRT